MFIINIRISTYYSNDRFLLPFIILNNQRSHTLRCPMSSSSSLIADNGNLGDTCLGLFLAGGLTPPLSSSSSSDNMTTLSFASRSLQLNFSTLTACCLAQDTSTVLEGYLFDELSSNLWMSLRIYMDTRN